MNKADKLKRWGIVAVFDDLRGAEIEWPIKLYGPSADPLLPFSDAAPHATILRRRASFTVDCLDCGPSEHVSPDDHGFAVCLRCGRDRWL